MDILRAESRSDTAVHSRRRDRVLTIVVATITALIVWAIARLLVGHRLTVESSGQDTPMTIGPVAVIVTTLIASLLGWAALALLERFTDRARRIWLGLAPVVLVVSLATLGQAIGIGTTIALFALHLVVGAVLIVGLLRTIPVRQV